MLNKEIVSLILILFLAFLLIREKMKKIQLETNIKDLSTIKRKNIQKIYIKDRRIFDIIEKINFSSFYFFSLKNGFYNILEFMEIIPHPSPFHSNTIDRHFFLEKEDDIQSINNKDTILQITGDCIADKMLVLTINREERIFLIITFKYSFNPSYMNFVQNIFNQMFQYYLLKKREIDKKIVTISRKNKFIDSLSLLKNREAFNSFDKYYEYSFLVMIDLDNFKRVNDENGHASGDRIISYFGKLLKKYFNDKTLLFRHGGDEFILITQFDVLKLKRIFNTINCELKKEYKYLGLSYGITNIKKDKKISDIINSADINLYKMKKDKKQ